MLIMTHRTLILGMVSQSIQRMSTASIHEERKCSIYVI
jgi:hypothetical protein